MLAPDRHFLVAEADSGRFWASLRAKSRHVLGRHRCRRLAHARRKREAPPESHPAGLFSSFHALPPMAAGGHSLREQGTRAGRHGRPRRLRRPRRTSTSPTGSCARFPAGPPLQNAGPWCGSMSASGTRARTPSLRCSTAWARRWPVVGGANDAETTSSTRAPGEGRRWCWAGARAGSLRRPTAPPRARRRGRTRARCRGTGAGQTPHARRQRGSGLGDEALQEVLQQQGQVARPVAQRRHRDLDDVDPVVEVLAEQPLGDALLAGRGGSPTGCRTSTLTVVLVPSGSKVPSCSTRSSLACAGRGSSATSSRNRVPPWAALKRPSRSLDRAGEGAPLVAEQLGLDQRLGQRPAVDHHEGAVARARCARAACGRPAPCRCRSRR